MTPEDLAAIYNLTDNELSDIDFADITKKRFNEAEAAYNSTESKQKDNQNRKLAQIREDNRKMYLSSYIEEQLIDDRYEEVYNDNRQFTAVRTLVPFVVGQLTAPQVTPVNDDDLSKLFATDFETALMKHAESQNAKYKVRLCVQDLLVGERVGIGMWRYDGDLDTVVFERLSPSQVTIGVRSLLYEEPDYAQIRRKRTPGQLIKQFPDKKDDILTLFGIEDTPLQLDEKQYTIKEEWIFLDIDGEKTLCVGWKWKDHVFGKIKDPNWKANGNNIIEHPMVPLVFFNILNDGSGYIDQTSFMEQTKHSQKQYNKRGQTISENARYSGTGVPIFAKGAIGQKDAAKIHFSPVQRVLLDTTDVNKAFTTWTGSALPQYIIEDQAALKDSVATGFGAENVFNGIQSGNKTATQDVLLRNQAEGRQGDLLDMVEVGMARFYQLEAQMMYMYFSDTQYYNYVGNDGKFISVAVDQKALAKNVGIKVSVKDGTSLPLDRAQTRATIIQLLQLNKIGTLRAYQELGLFDDPEKAFKEFIDEQVDAQSLVATVDDTVFDRDANEDLQTVIGGQVPDERDDVGPEYINFLNEWLLTDKYMKLQQTNKKAAARVSDFIDEVIAKAQRKADKLALQTDMTQQPVQPGTGGPLPPLPPGGQPPVPPVQGTPSGMPGGPTPAGRPQPIAQGIPSAQGAVV